MKYERGSFITVPSREKLRGMHPNAQILYVWLCSYANETGKCFPSRKTLATDCGFSENTVDRMLSMLVKNGLLTKKHQKVGDTNTSNLYTVLIAGGSPPQHPPSPHTGATVPPDVRTNSIQLTEPIEEVAAATDDEPRTKPKAKYKDARTAFSWLPNQQESWNGNLTELECGILLFKRGEESVRKFVKYVQNHKDDDGFNWRFVLPSDYERKWPLIEDYAKRNR